MKIYNINKSNLVLSACIGVAMLLGVTSCDLTRRPTYSIPLEEGLITYADAESWDRGIYTQFRNRYGGNFVTTQEIMADYLNASADFGNRGGDLHGWTELSASSGNFATIYQWYYSTMKNVNSTIENYGRVRQNIQKELDNATSESDKKKAMAQLKNLDRFWGDSYFARAYYYFNLMLRYGTPYNASSASTDLGVPLVLTFNVSDQVKRATVKECYDQIFKDLDEAEKNLKGVPNVPGSQLFNTDVVTALRARIYLEMKDYEKAYAEADKLISSGRYPLVTPSQDAFEQMWRHDNSSEFILLLPLRKGEETASSMGSYYGLNKIRKYHSPDWLPTQGMLDKFSADDLRKVAYFEDGNVIHYNNANFTGISIISKFKGNPAFGTESTPDYDPVPNGQHRPKIFRIPEQYLIMAEAAYFLKKDALTPLNALRVSRGLVPLAGVSGTKLLDEIKDERLRELAFEGFRLFDLRRWGDPIIRMEPQKTADGHSYFLNESPEYLKLSKPANDFHLVFAIPQRELNVYGAENMPQNPGW